MWAFTSAKCREPLRTKQQDYDSTVHQQANDRENGKPRDSGANDSPVHPNLLIFGRLSNISRGLTIIDDRSAIGCDLSHSVGHSGDLVQAE
jgi:hypothetical protein